MMSLIYKYNIPKSVFLKSLFARSMLRRMDGIRQISSRRARILPSCCACGVEPVHWCVSRGTDGLLQLC